QGFQLYSTMPLPLPGREHSAEPGHPVKSSQRVRVRDTKATGPDSTFASRSKGGFGVPAAMGLLTRVDSSWRAGGEPGKCPRSRRKSRDETYKVVRGRGRDPGHAG